MSKKHLKVQKLNETNLSNVMELQERIISGLHPDEQHFILHRTEADYIKSLNGSSSNMLGVFDGDKLIAQVVYGMPQNGEARDMPEFKPDTPNEDLVIYEAILVDPAYRGSSLMKRMLEYIETNAIDEGRKHSIIQIAVDNPASWINALHHGMSITKVDLDPTDGVKVIYLEKAIKHNETQEPLFQDNKETYSMYLGENIHAKIPSLFMKMQHLINKGYQGVSLNKETKSLIWQKDANLLEFNYALYQKHASTQAIL
ncbi:MAG: GNAT family N-acetyltransferase [Acetobacter sp.]|nr:GNAT family N-acetyltransferase [Acetobacter sp.]